jgi:hypothetical protein
MDRLDFHNIRHTDIFCHPDVPKYARYFSYRKDKNPRATHPTDFWHTVTCSGYTMFIDAMALYAKLRAVYGKEISYKLDYISNKYLDIGKLEIIPNGTHAILQKAYKVQYAVYNKLDDILVWLRELMTEDVLAMFILSGNSTPHSFTRQTHITRDAFYEYCLKNNKVPASSSGSQANDVDKLINKEGGTVLDPLLVSGVNHNILKEDKELDTNICLLVSDIDVSSMYPSADTAFNISKETKLSTAISIDGFKQEDMLHFFDMIAAPRANAERICSTYFKLPQYEELKEKIL